ncbi:MAG: ribosomal-processing cysteine protease Prp [Clostridiales bacterium]|nr:ribosomal-processing cysteine protease Prp [Clostridiales bacterium]
MIRIRIRGSQENIKGFTVRGHAGYAPRGSDVVCAGVSAVATAALMGLVKRLPGHVRYRISRRGRMDCRLVGRISDEAAREAQTILDVMAQGLREIQQSHKKYIDFSFRR